MVKLRSSYGCRFFLIALKIFTTIFLFIALLGLSSCDDPEDQNPLGIVLLSDFENGPQGWTPFFTNLPSDGAIAYRLGVDLKPIPSEISTGRNALQISGINRGNELFFFMKKEITNLQANRVYGLRFRIELATDTPDPLHTSGRLARAIEPAVLVAGGMAFEPGVSATAAFTGAIRPNFNYRFAELSKGSRTSDLMSLGPIHHDGHADEFKLIRMENFNDPFRVRANGQGSLWIVFGFKITTKDEFEIYLNSIRVLFNEL
jgi:hypothetical protein